MMSHIGGLKEICEILMEGKLSQMHVSLDSIKTRRTLFKFSIEFRAHHQKLDVSLWRALLLEHDLEVD